MKHILILAIVALSLTVGTASAATARHCIRRSDALDVHC